MTQDSKKLITNYLTNYFSIKRVKNKSNNWVRVVTIPGGYIRDNTKRYTWSNNLDLHILIVDLMLILKNVFYCSDEEAKEFVMNHTMKLSDSTKFRTPTSRTGISLRTPPPRRPLTKKFGQG
jgi:hypothetical protein